ERRLVDAGEEDALDAAGEERDPAAPRGPRGDELGQAAADLVKRDGRKELFHRGEAAREKFQKPYPAQGRREPEFRVYRPQEGRGAEAWGVREESEDRLPDELVRAGPVDPPLELGPRPLDQDVVLHARGAGRHAAHAPQAPVEVFRDGLAPRDLPFGEPAHQV